MINFFNNKKMCDIFAPITGEVVPIQAIPDEVFSERILGDGVGIIPSEDEIVSPVNGIIMQVADTLHAFGIRSDDGLEILVHVGVDTVALKGKGFEVFVETGQRVKAGQRIVKADIKFLKEAGYLTHSAVLITNMMDVSDLQCCSGPVKAGKTKVICCKI